MNEIYKCENCSKTYKIKENLKKHSISCGLFYGNCKTKLPDKYEMYNLIKTLADKCNAMEKKITKLQQVIHIRQKKQIIEYLNTSATVIKRGFTKWYKNIKINQKDLEKIFEEDLTEGIKHILKKHKDECICAFSQKPNVIYIYEDKWQMMTMEDIEKMINWLSREFMKEFISWKREHEKEIEENEKRKEEEIIYMIKVNGSKIPVEKRAREIKQWLYTEIEEKLDIYELE